MNRQGKELVIEALRNDFRNSEAMFLVDIHGMTVSQLQTLRKRLGQQNSKLKLAKNTLIQRAAADIPGMSAIDPYLKNQVAMVIARQESPAVAKIVADMARESERLKLVAGFFESRVLSLDMVQFLATLPPRPILLARVCGGMKSPLQRHVGVLHQVLARFLGTLKQIADKKQ